MARPRPGRWNRHCYRSLLSRPCPWGPPVRTQYPRGVRDLSHAHARPTSYTRHIPQTTPVTRHPRQTASLGCTFPWNCRQGYAHRELDTDDIWWNYGLGILS